MEKPAMSQVCTRCHSPGDAVNVKRSYVAISWILFGLFVLCVAGQVGMIITTPASLRNEPGWSTGFVGPTQSFFVAWLAHVAFRAFTSRTICPSCGAASTMVPAASPRGRQLLGEPHDQ